MGMFDVIVVLDAPSALRCPEGHALCSFHTKDLPGASMSTYLVQGDKLYLAVNTDADSGVDDAGAWRIEGPEASNWRRYRLQEVTPPRVLRVYGRCEACEPVLVRAEAPRVWSDIVIEHALTSDFRLTFSLGEPMQIERLSGTREDLEAEMRARGLFVLRPSDALAVAHRQLRLARQLGRARAKEALR